MNTTEHILATCPLVRSHAPRTCPWCGKRLAGRRRRWCSNECNRAFWSNHDWQFARPAAIIRDGGRCTRCGAAEPRPPRKPGPFAPDHAWDDFHRARIEFARATKTRLEVNHRVPLKDLGRSGDYGAGCHHHLSNLETLCSVCHVEETKRQRAERKTR